MTKSIASPFGEPSDDKTPRPILRAMDGAKAFLDPVLLNVPWLWRTEPVKIKENAQLDSDELRTYGKIIRSQINVYRFSSSCPDCVASSSNSCESVPSPKKCFSSD
jgi:hypothetical protein